jgi:hypothetical protein
MNPDPIALASIALAPIDSRQFACESRVRRDHPAACRLAPLLRLMLLAALGGGLVFFALGPKNAQAALATAAAVGR